jgi:hypothetical protein
LTALSALSDSALPGSHEEVSFFCADSNFDDWLAAAPQMRMKRAATTNFARRPPGSVKRRAIAT